jgi:anti-sigma regulatory factor (Ser/Thr protein kinase)
MTTNVAFHPEKPSPARPLPWSLILPAILLAFAYGLLGLTLTEHPGHQALMSRCVLMSPNLSRVWSVAHIELGLSYFGVFAGMLYHIARSSRSDSTHMRDLGLGCLYVAASFALDSVCVRVFTPFAALLIGDAVVMTFTAFVSRQVWFQRLLGVFVPLVFLTCSFGHLMEGLSFWQTTYPLNVPWTMVTADVGFAVLLNAARYPAFIRGQDIIDEMERTKEEMATRQAFMRDVLLSATQGRLRLAESASALPERIASSGDTMPLDFHSVSHVRRLAAAAADAHGFVPARRDAVSTAVGEAAMNAATHGLGGTFTIYASDGLMQVWIEDHGPGIQWTQLPQATLERGFSTKGSLGHGFWLILQCVDRMDLYTGKAGTTVVLTFSSEGDFARDGSPLTFADIRHSSP